MAYTSLKVPELRKLLQERSLPITGNKADLVSRLEENDKTTAPAAAQAPAEDEIDYSDDEVTITTKAAIPEAATAEQPEVAEPVPEHAAAENAEASNPEGDAAVAAAAGNDDAVPTAAGDGDVAEDAGAAATSAKFALNLPPTSTDEEAQRRADRAKRFGIIEDDETRQKTERAKRFGIDQADIAKSLDSALPERPLKRGRGRNEESGGGRKKPDRRDNNGNNNNNNTRGRGGRQGRTGGGRHGGGAKFGGSIIQDPAEKAKAEARAKRFGTAS